MVCELHLNKTVTKKGSAYNWEMLHIYETPPHPISPFYLVWNFKLMVIKIIKRMI